jgi:peptidoglycan-N-acetylglucosamine deacetylase
MRNFLLLLGAFHLTLLCFGQIIIKPIPDKTVVFTFDDATASQYSVVAPLLIEYGFDATFFICEFPPNFADSTLYMNWRQIGELDRMGFEIANHTRNHPGISKLTKEQLLDQLAYIESKCDSVGIEIPKTFAYPGYDLSLPAISILREKGYQFARAGGSRAYDPLTDHPLLLPSWALGPDNKVEIMDALGQAKDGKVAILTIHGVPDLEHPWVNTSREQFVEYLTYLQNNSYHVISLRELSKYVDTGKALEILIPDLSKPYKN